MAEFLNGSVDMRGVEHVQSLGEGGTEGWFVCERNVIGSILDYSSHGK